MNAERIADRLRRPRLGVRRADVAGSVRRQAAPVSGPPAPTPAPASRNARTIVSSTSGSSSMSQIGQGLLRPLVRSPGVRMDRRRRRTAGRGRAPRSDEPSCRGAARPRGRPAGASAPCRSGGAACRRASPWPAAPAGRRARHPGRRCRRRRRCRSEMPIAGVGPADQTAISCSVVGRSACLVQSG